MFWVTALTAVHLGWPYHAPLSSTALILAVAALAHPSAASSKGEGTLSRGLPTSPLPGRHASEGGCWQNGRCWHLLEEQHSFSDTLVAHPNCSAELASARPAAIAANAQQNGAESPPHRPGTGTARSWAILLHPVNRRFAQPIRQDGGIRGGSHGNHSSLPLIPESAKKSYTDLQKEAKNLFGETTADAR